MPKMRMDRTPLLLETVRVDGGSPSRPCLRVFAVPGTQDVDRLIPIRTRPTIIGRDATRVSADYVALPDPSLSREHVRVVVEESGRVTLKDAGSTNGTRVNGQRVETARLHQGDVVRIARTVLLVCEEPVTEDDDLGLLGRTAAMADLRRVLRRVGPSALPILVLGETGTGKELVSAAVHRLSGRRGRLVMINCAAIPENLVESTLFGHQRGAFTGATTQAPGAFVEADGGTLCLDEIGEMAASVQPKLLRALESGEVQPVGGTRARQVDVRVVAATHRELGDEVARGSFREDLFARLAGVVVRTPPLRTRRDDILPLLRRFLGAGARETPFEPAAAEALLMHAWPRNVRELVRLAERLPVLHPDATAFSLEMLGEEIAEAASAPEPPPAWPPSRDDLLRLLARFDGNVSEAARSVGRNRKQVYRWMDQLGIDRGRGR